MIGVRSPQRGDLAPRGLERVVDVGQVHAAHHVEHGHGSAARRPRDVAAAARRVGVVGRPQQARLDVDVVERLALVPDVVAGRDDVHALRKQAVADLARDAVAAGGVLAVDDDQVDGVARHQRRQPHADQIAAGAPDDVADKQQLHARRVDSMGTDRPVPRRSASFGSVIAQLAVGQRGADPAALEGAADAHRAGKAPGAALDQVIAAGAGARAGHPFLAGNQHDRPLHQDPQRRGGDAGHVEQDFDGFVGFDDVERRHAVAGGRAAAAPRRRPAPGAGGGRPRSGRPTHAECSTDGHAVMTPRIAQICGSAGCGCRVLNVRVLRDGAWCRCQSAEAGVKLELRLHGGI